MKDKIRALLALAADPSAAPQEAESAGRMAAKLMAKYQIDLGDLEEEALKEEFDLTTMQARACRPGKKNPKVVPPPDRNHRLGRQALYPHSNPFGPGPGVVPRSERGRRACRMASRAPPGERL